MKGMLKSMRRRVRHIATPDWADSRDEERQRAWDAYRDPDATETKETRLAKWKVRAMVASLPLSLFAFIFSLIGLSANEEGALLAQSASIRLPTAGATDFVKIKARDWLQGTGREVFDVEWRGWHRCTDRPACEVHTVHASLAWDTSELNEDDLASVAFLVGDPQTVLVGLDVAVTVGTSPLSVIGIALTDESVAPEDAAACPVGASAADVRNRLPSQFSSDIETWARAWVARDQETLIRHANDPDGRAQDESPIDGMHYISNSVCVQAVRDTGVESRKIVTVSLQSLRECGIMIRDDVARDEVAIRNMVEMAAHPCGVPLRTEVDLMVHVAGLNSHVVEVGPVGTIS